MSRSITGTREQVMLFLMKQPEDKKLWNVTEYKEKRSRSQNSYYWELAGKVASKTVRFGASVSEIHNRNLRALGLCEYINGELVCVYIPDTDEAEKAALNAESYHIKPTSQTRIGKDGQVFRCYVMLRGSHTFSVYEMSALVDLMVQEAKAVGVETLTPQELEHLRQLEEQNVRQKRVHG